MKAREADRAYRSVVNQHKINQKVIAHEQNNKEAEKQPVFVDKLTENVLIEIPGNILPRELPAALAAIHYYKKTAYDKAAAWSSMRKNYKRELTLNISIVCDEKPIAELVHRILDLPVYLEAPQNVYSYDMYHLFNLEAIDLFRENGKFHASSAYGIMLGCEAQSMFDIPVDNIIEKVEGREVVDILVLDTPFDEYKEVWEWIGGSVPNLKVSRVLASVNPFPSMIAAINDAKLIVAPVGMYSYLACCMQKAVYELYPLKLYRNWLSKWSNPTYAMYVCEKPDREVLLKGVANLWHKSYKPQSKLPQVLA